MTIAQNFPNIFNNNSFWIVLVFMGLSLASWVMGHLREQLRRKRANDEARRRFEEQLRTGRDPQQEPRAQPQARTPTMEELAARRQAQLEEIRRRQQRPPARAPDHDVVVVRFPPQGQPGGGATGQARQVPGGVVVQRFPQPGPPPTTARRSGPPPTARPPQPARGQRREDPRRRAAQEPQAPARASEPVTRAPDALAHATPAPSAMEAAALKHAEKARSPGRDVLFGGARGAPSREHLRRLIIASEVLGKPVSLREESA